MGDAPLMTPPTEQVEDLMSGIIERTSDYRNHKNAIGFSFRYYADQLVGNKGIKLLAVDGVAPTVENIRAGPLPADERILRRHHPEHRADRRAARMDPLPRGARS